MTPTSPDEPEFESAPGATAYEPVAIGASSAYSDEVRVILCGFTFQLCEECGNDIDAHKIAPDPLGHAHVFCLNPGTDEAGE